MTRSFDEMTDPSELAAQVTATGSFGMGAAAAVFPLVHKPLGSPLDPVWTCPIGGRATFVSVILGAAGPHTFQLKLAGGPIGGPIVTPAGPGAFSVAIPGTPAVPPGGDLAVDYTVGPPAADAQLTVFIEP